MTIETKFSYKIIQVFSDTDFLGWYSTGDSPGVQEITVHQQISDINESPLFLQANICLCVGFLDEIVPVDQCSFRWRQGLHQLTFQCHYMSL